jgi:peptidoglycan/xylan/chitin deacetylase (PgdA/CDA1 family)
VNRKRLTIVLYHGVDEARALGSYNYRGKFVTPGAFERQLAYYKKHYTVLPLDDAVAHLETNTLPHNTLAITFDDGYRNNYTHAYPLLKKYGLPATIFLTTDFVDKRRPLWVDRVEYAINRGTCAQTTSEKITLDSNERARMKNLPEDERNRAIHDLEKRCGGRLFDFEDDRAVYAPLSWNEVREMAAHGIMAGAHSKSHPILTSVSAQRAREEIEGSLALIRERVTNVSRVFAYPNGQPGDLSPDIMYDVRAVGFVAALTTSPGACTYGANPFELTRYTLDATEQFPWFVLTITGTRHIISLILHYAKGS